ncbi:MAG: hypothetical protein HKO62_04940 [Gammaproteobacteria bacterium]|nr:hypothetical protein [Gammaproteobacteria bacterium]NNM00075.1 hypothetical protein [Gammaproteobacteria bacterium]
MHRLLPVIVAGLAATIATAAPLPASAAFLNEADALRACELAIRRHDTTGPGRAVFETTYARSRTADGFTFYINATVRGTDGQQRQALRSTCRARGFAQLRAIEIQPGHWDLDRLTARPPTLMVSDR